MGRRKKKRRKKNIHEVDLHGMKHAEVYDYIENYILMNQYNLPIRIITGKSSKMQKLVREALDAHGFYYYVGLGDVTVTS